MVRVSKEQKVMYDIPSLHKTGILTHQQKRNIRLLMFLILLACYHNSIL